MPTWGELLKELNELARRESLAAGVSGPQPGKPSPYDVIRRKYLKKLSEYTGRAVIVYATAWQENKEGVTGVDLQVHLGDVQGFMEAVSNIDEKELDLFLNSPGGSPEAAEAIMAYLRTRFNHIRAVVPGAAMSAATMMGLAADEVLMGSHSQLGPIDPQLTISTPEGPRSAPAQAIIDQFETAKAECQDPANLAAWLPILRMYGPGLLATCDNSRRLAEEFASRNLAKHMFAGDADADAMAEKAAKWFANFNEFKSHGRRVSRDDARGQRIKVTDLEDDDELQDLVLSVHHATSLTLNQTPCFKLIENHHGRAWLQQKQQFLVQGGRPPTAGPGLPQAGPGAPAAPAPPGSAPSGPPPNRAARRRADRGR